LEREVDDLLIGVMLACEEVPAAQGGIGARIV
jgi:hypothetical protein